MEEQQSNLDKILDKVISRKLVVWIASTILLVTHTIQPSDWIIVSGVYIGSQSVVDIIAKLRGNV
jgi:hypothetical protein